MIHLILIYRAIDIELVLYLKTYQSMNHPSHDYSHNSNNNILEHSKNNQESDMESSSKTATRFPPITKNKTEDAPSLKQTSATAILSKKVLQESGTAALKRPVANLKKRNDKKKGKLIEIRPEIVQKYRHYCQFLTLCNLSNNLSVLVNEKLPNYVLYCGKGNNSGLIKSIFRTTRPWWTVEENHPDNSTINMFWFQLRQNDVLDNFKDNNKTETDFEHCEYYLEHNQEKADNHKELREASSEGHKTSQLRSQSVTQKDIKSTLKLANTKRSSSRTKGLSHEKAIPLPLSNLGKDLKDQIEMEGENTNKKKKPMANPKMWPIYHNYRKLFSQSEMKQLKKLKVLQQDGHLSGILGRNKQRNFQNRSNYFKIHNHLTCNWNLSNKKALFMNLKNYYDAQKINPFDYIPMTFHVTELGDKEFSKFQEEFDRRADAINNQDKKTKNQPMKGFKPKRRNAWLVKPGQNTNRGTGIQVVQSIEQIKAIIGTDTVDKQGRPRTHIIQQYIMPFLYQKRKFDIRSYICINSCNGYQKGYWYQDGYIRTASKQFNMKNLNNKFIHLTNDAVQKYHEDYGKFEPANKLSFADFQRYLDTVYNSNAENTTKYKFFQQAYPEMKKLAADAIRSVFTKINPTKKEFSFEIFGLDFLIDDNFKVWLIEANTNPCLELACPLLGRVIPNMLENAFKIVVDPLFPPPPIEQLVSSGKKFLLPENPLQSNKFELIFDEVEEGREIRALISNTPQVKIMQVEQEEDQYDENFNQLIKDNKHLLDQ